MKAWIWVEEAEGAEGAKGAKGAEDAFAKWLRHPKEAEERVNDKG